MDLNSLLFGVLAIISLVVFFFIGRYKAVKKQTERDDRIDWSQRQFSLWRIALYSLVVVLAVVLVTQLVLCFDLDLMTWSLNKRIVDNGQYIVAD